ncbi:hypothetical protein [Pseudophaeobacter profundi]|uniref:hypothetical protein n=1 Tax=Pseudophaeobacter profundi TaxID=3034152 RepID=UPI00242B4676|nr:hypothetical protein [Pseudophaeobacter profundi]
MSFLNSALSLSGLRKMATVATLALSTLLVPLHSASAAQRGTYVVGNDRGGYLHDRLVELGHLQRNGTHVQIRGRVCYSTCTMFLGLSDTCIDPNTTFGFHGPSQSGRRLAPQQFEYFSQVMADYYPAELRDWFMREGRHRISGIYKIKGSELIRMGVKPCGKA